MSFTGVGALSGIGLMSTDPPPLSGGASACLRHRALHSDGCRCGPRTAVPPHNLPHNGWNEVWQFSLEHGMSTPVVFRHRPQDPPLPLMCPFVYGYVLVVITGAAGGCLGRSTQDLPKASIGACQVHIYITQKQTSLPSMSPKITRPSLRIAPQTSGRSKF